MKAIILLLIFAAICIFILSLCKVAGEADERMERIFKEKEGVK